ncbi:MAG: thioredoxin family protein [Deltaproteobacteria bacterium]|nr:thioredoxin family protein [Deltaproteobacteria bacterium]
MALTPSTMLPLGTPLPSFELPDVSTGRRVGDRDFAGKRGLLVMFLCRHCPYVVHVQEELACLGQDYRDTGLGIVAVSSNDASAFPEDRPERLAAQALEQGFTFPYLHDATQEVARAFRAACTPDFFVFGPDRTLVYRGQLDDSRPGNDIPVTGLDLRAALDAVLAGVPAPGDQRPSMGCNIKWR